MKTVGRMIRRKKGFSEELNKFFQLTRKMPLKSKGFDNLKHINKLSNSLLHKKGKAFFAYGSPDWTK